MKIISNTVILVLVWGALNAQADINVGKGTISSDAVKNEFGLSTPTKVTPIANEDAADTIEVDGGTRGIPLLCGGKRGLGAKCDKPETTPSSKPVMHSPIAKAASPTNNDESCTEKSISMEVFFDYDSATLTQSAIQQLSPIGEALASDQLKGLSYRIEGYTDAVGGEAFNKNLSKHRAESVKRYLTENFKFTGKAMQTVGKGKTNLADPANPFSEKNRRVRIVRLSCK